MDDKFEAALARIAALESQKAAKPEVRGIDPKRFSADPIAELKAAGISPEHITKILVANALGDEAPADLRTYAMMGPQVSATQTLASELETLRRRIDDYEKRDRQNAVRQSFSALAGDKTKYPFLAAAYAKNPKMFESEISSHEGEVASLVESANERLKAVAEAAGFTLPASSKADESGQSEKTEARADTALDNTPPPISQPTPGVFTRADHERLIRKFTSQEGD